MRILGIDPGSEVTGYGLLESDGVKHAYVECGAIRLGARKSLPARLQLLCQQLSGIIARLRPECMALEDLFYSVNVKSALRLAHARGVIMLCAAQHELPVHEYSPLEVKNAVVGYGRAEKQQVQAMVCRLLRLEQPPQPLDATDALAVALCHAATWRTRQRIEEALRRSP